MVVTYKQYDAIGDDVDQQNEDDADDRDDGDDDGDNYGDDDDDDDGGGDDNNTHALIDVDAGDYCDDHGDICDNCEVSFAHFKNIKGLVVMIRWPSPQRCRGLSCQRR